MDFKTFEANVKVLDKQKGEKLRKRYIERFINTKHERYNQQIQERHKFCDGDCYIGYLWDYMKNQTIIGEEYLKTISNQINDIFVFWDIHSCERILIKDYWKFAKDAVIELNFKILLEGDEYLPEDIYIFDETMSWTLIKTHEDIEGKRYCLKSGEI